MGRGFIEQTLVTDSDPEDNKIMREDQVTQDLIQSWEVAVDKYVEREAKQRGAISPTIVRAELSVNSAVYDLLGSIPRLLARELVKLEEERESVRREQRR